MTHSRSFYLSLFLHAAVLAGFLSWHFTPTETIKYGEQEKQILSSYLVQTPLLAEKHENKTVIKKNVIALKKEKPLEKQMQQTLAQPKASLKGEPMPELIALLHAAIQKAQRYPASAQELSREGRATVSFRLEANGEVSDLKLVHSSGTGSLDNAALAAVADAAPFSHAAKYLSEARDYRIDVVFEL
jgi:TonB family protein